MKIAFFDIDGTLTSEIDGTIPQSAIDAIRKARENGHLMFINTGRCFQNVETRFREIGFDGYVCGCGTDIVIGEDHALYVSQSSEITKKLLVAARKADADILFESRYMVSFDNTRMLHHSDAIRQCEHFALRGYPMDIDIDAPDFCCDKFVIWYQTEDQLATIRKVSDEWFECIDRGGTFREFVPKGHSKATGIQFLLDYYHLPLDATYCFGDSNNDLPMLEYVKNSVAMGNSEPARLKDMVSYVTSKASEDGIANGLKAMEFI